MIDDDDFFEPIREDLSQMPMEQRAEYMHLRDLAALKNILVRFERGRVAVSRYGEVTRVDTVQQLAEVLAGFGLPIISQQELQRRAAGLFGTFAQALDEAVAPNLDH